MVDIVQVHLKQAVHLGKELGIQDTEIEVLETLSTGL